MATTCARLWEHKYEDLDLAGLNEKGEAFNRLLQACVTGHYHEVVDGKVVKYSKADTIEKIAFEYEQVTDCSIDNDEAALILWAFQMARGSSALEKREKLPDWANELYEDILLVTAFRRCGQGVYARYFEVHEEGEEGVGVSCWSELWDIWEDVKESLPEWLQTKLFKAMRAHLTIAGEKKAAHSSEGYRAAEDAEVVDELAIPRIDVHYSDMSSQDTVVLGDEEYTFEQLQGAFETLQIHCPLRKEGGALVPDGEPTTKRGDLMYWVDPLPGREILKRAAERYPMGVVLFSCGDSGTMPEVAQYIHFQTFLKLGAFLTGGSATGIVLKLVNMMIGISMKADNRPPRWDSMMRNQVSGLQGMIRNWVSKGGLKRIGRGGRILKACKVLTSHAPDVEPTPVEFEGKLYELPTARVNPNDDLVKVGGLKDGSIVGLTRTPMVGKFYAVLVHDDAVPVASVKVNAFTWARANRGDGDGDPLAIENCAELSNF